MKRIEASTIEWLKPQSNIPIVLFTGFEPNDLVQYQREVISLGGIIAKQPCQATHLIVEKIERTAKFVDSIFVGSIFDKNRVSVTGMLLELKLQNMFCMLNGFAFTTHTIFKESPLVVIYWLIFGVTVGES